MVDYEAGMSAPATPGTPTPLMPTSFRVDSLSYDRKSMPRCKCLPIDAPTWGAPHTCLTDFAVPDISLTRKLGAEFVGTFILIFAATAGPIVNQKYNGAESLLGNAACAGLAVMIVILSTGHISGAHLNPSLTIAFAALRHFPWIHVPAYIIAQISASICASFALKGVFHPFMSGGVTIPSVSTGQAFALEFLITFNLLFVVTGGAHPWSCCRGGYLYARQTACRGRTRATPGPQLPPLAALYNCYWRGLAVLRGRWLVIVSHAAGDVRRQQACPFDLPTYI